MKKVFGKGLLVRVVREGQEEVPWARIVRKGCEERSGKRTVGEDCSEGL